MSLEPVRIKLLWLLILIEVGGVGILILWSVLRPGGPALVTIQRNHVATAKGALAMGTKLVADKLDSPVAIAAPPSPTDKRLFVVEEPGRIRLITANRQLAGMPFLDITSKVQFQGEMGLLGLAFHPHFAQNGYFYVYYINKQKQSVLARYHLDKTTGMADPSSEKVLLTLQQVFPNHKGGQLSFGPDGYLYLGLGDGGSGGDPNNHGQTLDNWFGKILRLDVDHGDPYAIPASNPFAKQSSPLPEIWAYGLRNPWRFSFDRATGDLYIADVGQNKYEELDIQPAKSRGGQNYGWRCYEATHVYDISVGCAAGNTYTMPALEYDHSNNRCAIVGGYVYRGRQQAGFGGKYFYGDYCSGEILYATKQDGVWQSKLAAMVNYPTTFGQDSRGELYVASQKDGAVYQLVRE